MWVSCAVHAHATTKMSPHGQAEHMCRYAILRRHTRIHTGRCQSMPRRGAAHRKCRCRRRNNDGDNCSLRSESKFRLGAFSRVELFSSLEKRTDHFFSETAASNLSRQSLAVAIVCRHNHRIRKSEFTANPRANPPTAPVPKATPRNLSTPIFCVATLLDIAALRSASHARRRRDRGRTIEKRLSAQISFGLPAHRAQRNRKAS